MIQVYMSRSIIIGLFFVGCFSVSNLLAQGDARYLYIQSEPVRRFELVHAGVVKGASPMGYLILPGLPAGVVEFILRTEEDRAYRVDLTSGDKGLGLRKNAGAWYLVDLKTGQSLESVVATGTLPLIDSSDASPFARLLSKAVQDPTLLSNHRAGKKVMNVVQQDKPASKDSVDVLGRGIALVSGGIHTDTIQADTVARPLVASTRLEPVRLFGSADTKGVWEATYLVLEGARVDTVRVEFAEEKRIVDTMIKEVVTALPAGCVAEMTEPEFLQLRTRMAAAQDEDEMVLMVRRVVRTQCLSVSQIRRLSNVFLYDETRYRFYDAVYGHVTDPIHFSELSSYLSDPVYQRRFRALLER